MLSLVVHTAYEGSGLFRKFLSNLLMQVLYSFFLQCLLPSYHQRKHFCAQIFPFTIFSSISLEYDCFRIAHYKIDYKSCGSKSIDREGREERETNLSTYNAIILYRVIFTLCIFMQLLNVA